MTKRNKGLEKKAALLKSIWDKYVANYELFLWGEGGLPGLLVTLDEHETGDSPAKPLPSRPHLKHLARLWKDNQTLLVFKSRQLMVSWLFCSLILWDSLKPGKRYLIACKKFEGADALLDRIWFSYQQLPEALRPKAERKQGFITFFHEDGNSIVQAASQTSEDPRQHTFTGCWVDEGEFTDNASELHTAMLPTIQGGGKFFMTTTPNGKGYFYQVATDNGRISL